jgi:hypothetical protein
VGRLLVVFSAPDCANLCLKVFGAEALAWPATAHRTDAILSESRAAFAAQPNQSAAPPSAASVSWR